MRARQSGSSLRPVLNIARRPTTKLHPQLPNPATLCSLIRSADYGYAQLALCVAGITGGGSPPRLS